MEQKSPFLFWIDEDTKTGAVTIGNQTGTVTLPKEQAPLLADALIHQTHKSFQK